MLPTSKREKFMELCDEKQKRIKKEIKTIKNS
jgi:hypothetical protein